MNRHLNAFMPYSLVPGHEDNLTRAAMIVMRAVPAAARTLLELARVTGTDDLPALEVDMQTDCVLAGEQVEELVSVFLTPDVEQPGAGEDLPIRHSDRRQRLDGVLRFEPRLVVLVESKVYEKQGDWQAQNVNLAGVRAESTRKVSVRWHDLLAAWWRLLEAGGMPRAERVLVSDVLALADEHFPITLPFSTLGLAGSDSRRRMRRLRSLLESASGLPVEDKIYEHAHIRLDISGGPHVVQRAALSIEGDRLVAAVWPAEDMDQARRYYRDGRALRAAALDAEPGWRVTCNPHLAFWRSRAQQRWYLHPRLSAVEYAEFWSDDLSQNDLRSAGAKSASDLDHVWTWLLEEGLSTEGDAAGREGFARTLGRRKQMHLRPGMRIDRSWSLEEAVRLDDQGSLVASVRAALDRVLEVLDEPPLPPST
jgi:hypothetical protein